MTTGFSNALRVEELKKRLLFTFAMLAVAMFPLMSIALAAPLCWLMAVLLINVPAFLFLERRRRRAALHAS